jgi:uncharacterized protein YcfJ
VVEDYHEEERILGYRVTYRYRGKLFTTRLAEPPGDRLRLRVSLQASPR